MHDPEQLLIGTDDDLDRIAATALERVESAVALLGEITDIALITEIRDRAEAVRQVARTAGASLELQNRAARVKLLAERRGGELLPETITRGGDPKSHDATLADLGLDRHRSSRWQRLARVPIEAFEARIAAREDAGLEVTQSDLLRLSSQLNPRPARAKEDDVSALPVSKDRESVAFRRGRIRGLAAEGHRASQIADLLNISEQQVRKLAREDGIRLPDAAFGKTRRLDVNRILGETVHRARRSRDRHRPHSRRPRARPGGRHTVGARDIFDRLAAATPWRLVLTPSDDGPCTAVRDAIPAT